MIDPITLDQLRIFITVCDAGSFSAAARQLRRAQSAISRAIIMLEGTIDVPLFDRSGHVPKLTEAGRSLAVDARAIIDRIDDFKTRAANISDKLEPTLNVSVHFSIPSTLLTPVLKNFEEIFPLVPITLHTAGIGGVLDHLLDESCSLCICPIPSGLVPPSEICLLERNIVGSSQPVMVVASSHPLANYSRDITLADLKTQTQLSMTERSTMTRNWEATRVISERVWRLADLNSKRNFLLAGFGWADMPFHIVAEDIEKKRLKRLTVQERLPSLLPMPIYIGFHQSRAPGRAGQWLIEALRNHMAANALGGSE